MHALWHDIWGDKIKLDSRFLADLISFFVSSQDDMEAYNMHRKSQGNEDTFAIFGCVFGSKEECSIIYESKVSSLLHF